MTTDTTTYSGTCYCGDSRVTVSGAPVVMVYCHCRSCRKWHSAPFIAGCQWPADKVVFEGETTHSKKNDESHRVSCSRCGGALANIKPRKNMVAVYAMTLAESGLVFEPIGHIFYGERVFDMADGLPKWETVPEAFGGDGVMVDEPASTRWLG